MLQKTVSMKYQSIHSRTDILQKYVGIMFRKCWYFQIFATCQNLPGTRRNFLWQESSYVPVSAYKNKRHIQCGLQIRV
jgi:hypothetical protein